MGNKRKAVAIILGVIVFAAGIISGAFWACKPNQLNDTPVTNAATVSDGSSASITGNKRNGNESAYFSVTSGRVYLVKLYGQKGGDTGVGGYNDAAKGTGGLGYIVRGYYKANSSSAQGTIGAGGGSPSSDYGYNIGGGYTSFPINFGRPSGYTPLTTGYAGGGGAAFSTASGFYAGDGGNAGFRKGDSGGKAELGNNIAYGGNGGTWNGAGTGGSCNGESGSSRYDGDDGAGSAGGSDNAAGGGGYYGGGGGGLIFGKSYNTSVAGGGGGGSSSPNTYDIGLNYMAEIPHTDCSGKKDSEMPGGVCSDVKFGKIALYDVTPTKNPTGSSVKLGETATIIDGTAQNGGGKIEWQYSTDNKSWSTTKPTRTEGGTTTVYWRYVITESNVASNESVIASGSLSLTVEQAAGTVDDPTLTGNGSATYSGNNIQVVTKLGSASGVFKYAVSTKKIDAGAQASTYEAQGLAFASTLDAAQNFVKNAGTYYVYYYSGAGNNYLASTVKRATFVVGKRYVSLTTNTAAGRTGLVYNGSPQSLFTGALGRDPNMGTIKYGVASASDVTANSTVYVSKLLSCGYTNIYDVKVTKAGKYYLCATIASDNTNNYVFNCGDGMWWVCDVYTVIEKGTVTAVTGIEIKPDRVYDGSTQNFFEVSSSGVKASQGDALSVSYTRNYTLTNFTEAKKA